MVGKKRKLSDGDVPHESMEFKKLKQTVDALTARLRDRDEQNERMNLQITDLSLQLDSLRRQVNLAAPPRDQPHIHDLPDQLVLRILALLDPLFVADAVAAVCRRWRALACSPTIWEGATLQYGNTGLATAADFRRFARALAAAPVLDSLECGLTAHDPAPLQRALEASRAATAHLCLNLDVSAPETVLRLLHNSLRRLNVFCLREGPISASAFSERQVARFWQLVEDAAAASLRCLVLFLSQHSGLVSTRHRCRPSSKPSAWPGLRTLFVDIGLVEEEHPQAGGLALTLSSLIDAHRDSLQDVHLPLRVPAAGALKALSRCRALKRVSMPAQTDVSALASCSQLQVLRLRLDQPQPQPASRLLHGLGQLQHLRELELVQQPPRRGGDAELAADLVHHALSELPGLRQLSVTCLPQSHALRRLARLPPPASLELLAIDESCGDTLDAVAASGSSPASCRLPALRRLLSQWPGVHVLQSSAALGAACTAQHRNLVKGLTGRSNVLVGHDGCLVCEELALVGFTILPCGQPARGDRAGDAVAVTSSCTSPARTPPASTAQAEARAAGTAGPSSSSAPPVEVTSMLLASQTQTSPASSKVDARTAFGGSAASPRGPLGSRCFSPIEGNTSPPIVVSIALERLEKPGQNRKSSSSVLPTDEFPTMPSSSQGFGVECLEDGPLKITSNVNRLAHQISEKMKPNQLTEDRRSPAANGSIIPTPVGTIVATPSPRTTSEEVLFNSPKSVTDSMAPAVPADGAASTAGSLRPPSADSPPPPDVPTEGDAGGSGSRKNKSRACRPISFKAMIREDFEEDLPTMKVLVKKAKSKASQARTVARAAELALRPLGPLGQAGPRPKGPVVKRKITPRRPMPIPRPHPVAILPARLIAPNPEWHGGPATATAPSSTSLDLPRTSMGRSTSFQSIFPLESMEPSAGFFNAKGRFAPLRKSAPAALFSAHSSFGALSYTAAPPTAPWPACQRNEDRDSARQAGTCEYLPITGLGLPKELENVQGAVSLNNVNINNNCVVPKSVFE